MNWDDGVIIVCILCNVVSFLSTRAAKNDDRLDLNIWKAKVITPQLFNVSKGHQTQRALAKPYWQPLLAEIAILFEVLIQREGLIFFTIKFTKCYVQPAEWNQIKSKIGRSIGHGQRRKKLPNVCNECIYYMYYVKWSVKWHKFVHLSQKADKNVAFGSGKGARGTLRPFYWRCCCHIFKF